MVDLMGDHNSNEEPLYLGIDVGSFKTSICTSDGKRFSERTIVALSKDAENNEGSMLSGKEDMEITDTEMKELLNDGLKSDEDTRLFRDFLKDLLIRNDIDLNKRKVYAIIAVSSDADNEFRKKVLKLGNELFEGAMLVDGTFCIAYNKDLPEGSLVVDIGYTGTDICITKDDLSQEIVHLNIPCAGKNIDTEVLKLINERWPDSILTGEITRKWKEEHGHLLSPQGECMIEVPLEDGAVNGSIADEIQIACEFVVTDIISSITRILSEVDPDLRGSLRNNIHIFGGTSKLHDIVDFMETELKEVGGGKIFSDLDPVFGISEGALDIARSMPLEFWKQLDAEKQNKELIT